MDRGYTAPDPNLIEGSTTLTIVERPGIRDRVKFEGTELAQRRLGAYYTGSSTAVQMVQWLLQGEVSKVLEPSFGGGVFLEALRAAQAGSEDRSLNIIGAEISAVEVESAIADGLLRSRDIHRGDFLSMQPTPVDAVIGNPPYVRLRNLSERDRNTALRVAQNSLGLPMDTSGSLWMPFVLHAMSFLKKEGRMALVLPYEFTYVKYALDLWQKLGASFGELRVVRVHERLFPDILQEVVILYADGFGRKCSTVRFSAFEDTRSFVSGSASRDRELPIKDIVAGKRCFTHALLSDALLEFLAGRGASATVPVKERCAFNIGYVCGDKDYFHPSPATKQAFSLKHTSLRPAVTSSRQLKASGIRSSNLGPSDVDLLFIPPANKAVLSKEDAQYVKWGEANGIHERYKCQVRTPWYQVPGVKIPDLLLSVFADRPLVMVNDGQYVATNSLLCGYLRKGTAEALAAAWYTSLSLLSCELELHSLGGGVMILVPNEVGRVRIPDVSRIAKQHLDGLDRALKNGDELAAYEMGDDKILRGILGLTKKEVELIHAGIATLRHWRTSVQGIATKKNRRPSGKNVQEEMTLLEC